MNLFSKFKNLFSSPSYPRTLALVGILIIIIALPITVFVLQQRTNFFQHASCTVNQAQCDNQKTTCYSNCDNSPNQPLSCYQKCDTQYNSCLNTCTSVPTTCNYLGTPFYTQCGQTNLSTSTCPYVADPSHTIDVYPPSTNTCGAYVCIDKGHVSGSCGFDICQQQPPVPGVCNGTSICTELINAGNTCGATEFINCGPAGACNAPTPTPPSITCSTYQGGTYRCTNYYQNKEQCGTSIYGGASDCSTSTTNPSDPHYGSVCCLKTDITTPTPTPHTAANPYPGTICASSNGNVGVCMFPAHNTAGWTTDPSAAHYTDAGLPDCATALPGTVGGSDDAKSCNSSVQGYKCCVYPNACLLTTQTTTGNVGSNTGKVFNDRCVGKDSSGTIEVGFCGYAPLGIGTNVDGCNSVIKGTHQIDQSIQGCAINLGAPSECCAYDANACYNPNTSPSTTPPVTKPVTPPVTPSCNGANCVTLGPSTPTCTPGQSTSFNLAVKLQGIGSGTFENNTPLHPTRTAAYVKVTDETGTAVFNQQNIQFTYTNGTFNSSAISIAASCGHTYTVTVKLPLYVKASNTVAYGQTNQTVSLNPTPGDLVPDSTSVQLTSDNKIIGDDLIDTSDYNIIRMCHNDPSATETVTVNTSTITLHCPDLMNLFDFQDGGVGTDPHGISEFADNYNLWLKGYFKANGFQ